MVDRIDKGFEAEERQRIEAENKEKATLKLADMIAKPLLALSGAKEGSDQWHNVQDCAMMISRYASSVDQKFIQAQVETAMGNDPRSGTIAQAILGVVQDSLKPAAPTVAAPQMQAPVAKAQALKV